MLSNITKLIEIVVEKYSSYVKLQDAYVAEAAAVGNWAVIGYKMPASTNFKYDDIGTYTGKSAGASVNNTVNIDDLSNFVGWEADNNAKLNDCPMHSKWTIAVDKPGANETSASVGLVKYAASIDNDTQCLDVTPNFGNIGK